MITFLHFYRYLQTDAFIDTNRRRKPFKVRISCVETVETHH